jgi:hypothetical protein
MNDIKSNFKGGNITVRVDKMREKGWLLGHPE